MVRRYRLCGRCSFVELIIGLSIIGCFDEATGLNDRLGRRDGIAVKAIGMSWLGALRSLPARRERMSAICIFSPGK